VANVTIYLDDSLRERVRQVGLPISRVCQQALRAQLAERDEKQPSLFADDGQPAFTDATEDL
jgi:post-segregation antitoxin (ccd killing protein)